MVTHKKPPSTTLQRFAGTLCVVGIAGLTALGMGVTDAAPAPHETAPKARLVSAATPRVSAFPTAAVLRMHSTVRPHTVTPVASPAPQPAPAPPPVVTTTTTPPVTTPVTAPAAPPAEATPTDPLGLIPQFESLGASAQVADEFVCIAWAESRDEPGIVNEASQSSGLFQFMPSTWASIGMPGLPEDASVATQVEGAWRLFQQRGFQPWTGDPCVS